MGKENDALLSYLEDNRRFADLFNGLYFGGTQEVMPQELREASEVYTGESGGKKGQGGQRVRDLKKRLESGGWLRILAVEAQSDVSYCMPWRVMDYDCREYGKQIREIQRRNQREDKARGIQRKNQGEDRGGEIQRRNQGEDRDDGEAGQRTIYASAGERLGRFRRRDRIAPVYTLCLYHGAEEWDGPRSLKDMINFGSNGSKWEKWFADYPMRLVCVNEPVDSTVFRTSLGIVFALLPLRKDKAALGKLIEADPAYRKMDEETAQTVSALMGVKGFMKQLDKYKEEEGYNMCQAIREMIEDGRVEGRKEGRKEEKAEGIRIFIQSNRDDGIREEVIAEKLQKYYAMTREKAEEILKN